MWLELKQILKFGWPYLRRYWFRMAAGVLLGMAFGVSNAGFIWGTKVLFERLDPKTAGTPVKQAKIAVPEQRPAINPSDSNGILAASKRALSSAKQQAVAWGKKMREDGYRVLDQWLPLRGRRVDWRQIVGGLSLLPVLAMIRGYIGFLSSYCMAWVSERVTRDVRVDLLRKFNSLSMDFFHRSTIGELLMRVNGDATALYRCLNLGFSDLVKEPITVISLVIGLFVLDWQLALLAIVFTPLTMIPIRILGNKAKTMIYQGLGSAMNQDSLLVEVYTSIRVVKAYCLEEFQLSRFKEIYHCMIHLGMKSTQARQLVNPIIEVISMVALGVVIVFIFFFEKNIPELVGFLTGVALLYTPIKKLANMHMYFQMASVGAVRLVQLFEEQPSVKEKQDAVPCGGFQHEIRMENLSFGYGDKLVLQDVNLVIPRGSKFGIAGESGAGKSTLVNLLFRFYDPTQGSIKIDGIDLRDLRTVDLRSQMALVSQEVFVFDQTVAENIACGKPGATRQEVETAARAAYAHDFITALPQGYDTRVGERGQTLSAGQRQRLSIARAFIRNAPILVLDEATASLDSQSEAEVQAAIDRLAEDRTVISVAHRLSTLARMDQVIVFSAGRIVEVGSFRDLIALENGVFARMAAMQGIFPGSAKGMDRLPYK